jgi:hypothetical protein
MAQQLMMPINKMMKNSRKISVIQMKEMNNEMKFILWPVEIMVMVLKVKLFSKVNLQSHSEEMISKF